MGSLVVHSVPSVKCDKGFIIVNGSLMMDNSSKKTDFF